MNNRICRTKDCNNQVPPKANPAGRGKVFCASCVKAKHNAQHKDSPVLTCKETGCERLVRAKQLCSLHYKRHLRSQGKLKEPWNDRRIHNHHTRRARMNGAHNADRVLLSQLIERGGLTCPYCLSPIDLDIKWPDRLSKSIDHIIPIKHGGLHNIDNTQLMHLGCNSAKGATTPR